MPQPLQQTPTMKSAAASSDIFVSQICWREMGWASRLQNVPALTSAPKELSASITAIAPENTKAITNHHQPMSEPSGWKRKARFGSASAQQIKKLGISRRISFLTNAFMFSPFSKYPTPRKFPPATAIRSAAPPASRILIQPAIARCCRWRGFPLRGRFVSRSRRPTK